MPPLFIPESFKRKKHRILLDLAVPSAKYTDASPKGSVDEGIKKLIEYINGLDGYVTTSSCAGRLSVFAEGKKKARSSQEIVATEFSRSNQAKSDIATIGGKGGGGKWLFVSHEPIDWQHVRCGELFELKGLSSHKDERSMNLKLEYERFLRLAFEPMILHVMCASLHHARPLLSAAINAGFRESGVQSLKNLDDLEACPMVAIRTAGGLSLQSVIGFVESNELNEDRYYGLIPENHLKVLFEAANAKFEANSQLPRIFRNCLKDALETQQSKALRNIRWEDPIDRKIRKRQEGLAMSRRANGRNVENYANMALDNLFDSGLFPSDHDYERNYQA